MAYAPIIKIEKFTDKENDAQNSGTRYAQNPNSQSYLSLLVTSKDASSNNQESNQTKSLTSNIFSATVIDNDSLATIFLFELEELSFMLLFSRAILEEKPITAMYTNAKVNSHFIKLILDSRSTGSIITKQLIDQLDCQIDRTASARIIMTDGVTKTSISEIDDFFFEVNGIIIPIKVLVIEAMQYQALVGTCCDDDEEWQMATKFYCHPYNIKQFGQPKKQGKWNNKPYLACSETLLNEGMWNKIPGRRGMCNKSCQYTILISDWIRKKTLIDIA
ncbi:hypothetical protein G9A89_016592 [Geosiphon pyriformis]|nr:hypothetical protein G9A89_016592 [Geosiphon pyriformis]